MGDSSTGCVDLVEVQAAIMERFALVDEQIAKLVERIAKLEAENAELRAEVQAARERSAAASELARAMRRAADYIADQAAVFEQVCAEEWLGDDLRAASGRALLLVWTVGNLLQLGGGEHPPDAEPLLEPVEPGAQLGELIGELFGDAALRGLMLGGDGVAAGEDHIDRLR